MPELPEVETLRRGLAPEITGDRIVSVDALFERSMPVARGDINSFVIDAQIQQIRRRGKVLIMDLSSSYSILVHLKMTGQLILELTDGARTGGGHPTSSIRNQLPDKSTRVVFTLSNGGRLFFNDQRKFGWVKVLPTEEVEELGLLARMAVEPLTPAFTLEAFQVKVAHRNSPIKPVLLNQENVAGLGNIYVDESLHLARIHPLRQASSLSDSELTRLHQAIITILEAGVKHEGTTLRNFMNQWGEAGYYFDHARVFDRTGEACRECGSTIEKLKVAGRGTHICPRCQVL